MLRNDYTIDSSQIPDTGMVHHASITASDTKTTYSTITWRQIATLVQTPKSVESLIKPKKDKPTATDWFKETAKAKAGWFTPSTLLSRDNEKQREHGQFLGCALDFDEVPDYVSHIEAIKNLLGKMVFMSHSTASASVNNQKMRVLIPFNAPIDGKTYAAVVQCIYEDLKAAGLNPDKCMLDCNRVYFLPFKGDLYYWNISDGHKLWGKAGEVCWETNVDVETLEFCADMLFDPLEIYASRIDGGSFEQDKIDQEVGKAVAAERRRLKKSSGRIDIGQPIDWFNQCHNVEDLLLASGYESKGGKYRHKNSQSGSFSGIIFSEPGLPARYFTLSTSDPLFDDQKRSHDAFSVFTVLDHGGDERAALDSVRKMRESTTSKLIGSPQQVIKVTDEDIRECSEISYLDDGGDNRYQPAFIEPFRGVMADLTNAIKSSSFKIQPTLASAGALSGMASGVPRNYCIQGGTRIGLYTLLLSPTGSGKDHIEQSAKEIAQSMDCGIVGGGLSSGQGLEDHLIENQNRANLLHMTEAAHVLQCYHASNRNNQPHVTFLFSVLLSLYSTRGSYVTRSLAGKLATSIEKPAFNFLAASTIEKLGSVVTRENIVEGLLNRMLFVMGDSKPDSNYSFGNLVFPHSFETAKFALTPTTQGDIHVGMTTDAEALKRKIGDEYDQMCSDEVNTALFGRSYEKVVKVAATLAVWDCMAAPRINVEHLEYARYFVDQCNKNLIDFIERFMFGSETQKNADVIFKALVRALKMKKAGSMRPSEWAAVKHGIAPKSVVLRMSHLEVKLFDAAMDHLRAIGKVDYKIVRIDGVSTKPITAIVPTA